MKMFIAHSVFAFLFLSLSGCSPDDTPPQPTEKKDPVVWKVERDLKGLSSPNYFYKDMVIQGTDNQGKLYQIVALSADSGAVIWKNTSWPEGSTPYDIDDVATQGNIMVVTNRRTVMALELDEGKTLWTYEFDDPSVSGVRIIDGWVYKSGDNQTKQGSTMYRFDLKTGNREEVFTITRPDYGDNIYAPDLKLPVKWTSPEGDELLITHNRSYGGGTNGKERMDVLAWNLSADSLEWYRKGLDEGSSSSGAAISGDNVYFFGTWHAYSIDPSDGSTNWSYNVGVSTGGDFNTANILVVDDLLIVKQENRFMTAIDKETGNKVWFNPETAAMPYLLREHNDTIWFASGGILAIDASCGQLLFKWDNDGKGWWSNSVLPHPTNGKIFTTDGDFIYCLDPKHMK